MSENPNIRYINISELAGSRAEIVRIVDLMEAQIAVGIGKAAVEKDAAFQADSTSHNPFRRIRALAYRYRMWRYMRGRQ